jgi:hypothetical protein
MVRGMAWEVGIVYIDNQWDLLGGAAEVSVVMVAVAATDRVVAVAEHLMFQHKEFPKDERNSG